MRTSFDLPLPLLEQAKDLSGAKTKTQAIVVALSEFIQRRKGRKILKLKGSMDDNLNYRDVRKKS